MKKLLMLFILMLVMLVPVKALAVGEEYEVPVELVNASTGKESMANKALEKIAKVVVTEEGEKYSLTLVPMEFMNLKGNVTNLFILDGENRVEAKKTVVGDKSIFEFTRSATKEKELKVAVWVDAMDSIQGGKPGAGEQKALLKFAWDQVKEGKVEEKVSEKVENSKRPKILVNDKEIQMDVAAYIENGRTMVPVRFISEALGLKVDWDGDSQTVFIGDSREIEVKIGENKIKKSGNTIEIDAKAELKDSRAFVPLRAIAEMTGSKVAWDGNTNTVKISK